MALSERQFHTFDYKNIVWCTLIGVRGSSNELFINQPGPVPFATRNLRITKNRKFWLNGKLLSNTKREMKR